MRRVAHPGSFRTVMGWSACREVGVDGLHRPRPLTNGGGTSLGGAGVHVPGREDAGDGGLEQVVGADRRTGENEAVVVASNHVVGPVGGGHCAEEQEREPQARVADRESGDQVLRGQGEARVSPAFATFAWRGDVPARSGDASHASGRTTARKSQ
jgi:hypothetical protein